LCLFFSFSRVQPREILYFSRFLCTKLV